MKIDLAAYGYENFKPKFDNVTAEDLLTKSPFDVPNSLAGYILPPNSYRFPNVGIRFPGATSGIYEIDDQARMTLTVHH